jgi:predicted amidohydrolase YtcJ
VAATAQRPRPPANQAEAWQADIILSNGKITTLSEGTDPVGGYVDSIAIRDGEVVAIGSADYVRHLKGPGTQTVDLKGRRVLPGLIDGHIHGNRNGYHCFSRTVRQDLVTSRAAALAGYTARDSQLADDIWVWTTSGGWNVNQLDTPGMFTIAELDAASPGNPVWVQASGFSGTQVNSKALSVLGLTAGSPGVEVNPATGLPTGRLTAPANTMANSAVLAQLNAQSIEEIAECLEEFIRTSNRLGMTAWNDADGNTAPWGGPGEVSQGLHGHQAIIHLRRNDRLNARVALHMAGNYAGLATALSDTRNAMGFMGDDMLRYMGSGEDNDPFTDADHITFTQYAAANRLSVEHHVGNHDRNLTGYEAANEVYPISKLKWTIAHPSDGTPTDQQLARAGALGIGYTLTFSSVRNGGTGPRFRSTMNSDARMCLASDAMNVAPWAPFQNLWYVTTGQTLIPGVQGVPADQRLTRIEALRHATVNCAWNLDQEGDLGTLDIGNHADLIVLSDDYFTVEDSKIKDIHSLLTVVDGRVVYAEGEYADLED